MARKAEFSINGLSVMAELKKVDRKKIYGWSTIEVFDQNGSKCKLAGLAEGQYVMPSGSSALVSLNAKGEAVSKSTLVGVNSDGNKVEKVPSIIRKQRASIQPMYTIIQTLALVGQKCLKKRLKYPILKSRSKRFLLLRY